MKRISTHTTFEDATIPILFPDVGTSVAGLACEVACDVQTRLSKHSEFILGEVQELCGTPTSKIADSSCASSAASSHFHSCRVQFLEGNSVTITICDCLADAVVGVSDEPSLSSTQEFEMFLCAWSACSLQDAAQVCVASLHLPEMSTIEELSVTGDCGIDESPIDTDDAFWLAKLRFCNLELDVEQESTKIGRAHV